MKIDKIEEDDEILESPNSEVAKRNISQKRPRIPEDEQQDRLFLPGMLLERKEDLLRERAERDKKRNSEEILLISGKTASIRDYVAIDYRPYFPEFPNGDEFFAELFRINFPTLDPKEYRKPAIVGKWIKAYLYYRFGQEVFKELDARNPIIPGMGRKRKIFQHLQNSALEKFRQFKQDAVDVMNTCREGEMYKFKKEMYKKYGVPYQVELYKSND